MLATDRWHFSGDVNLEYGGAFIDLSTWDDGYCDAVRITDLDSGCGFTGAVLIEHVVILGVRERNRITEALKGCGYELTRGNQSPADFKQSLRHMIAEALMSYGFTDPDDCWDGYRSHHTEVVQMEADGPMIFDGWKADKRLRGDDLEGYVKAVHLRD